MKRKINYLDLILKIVLGLVGILVIVWAIQLIFGGSPSLSEFNFAIAILLVTFLFKIYREIGEIKTDINHNFFGVKKGFKDTKEDILLIKNKMKIK